MSRDSFPIPRLPERRRRARRVQDALFIAGVALVAFIVGLSIFNSFVMPRLIHSSAEVHVPDLSNVTLEQAQRALEAAQLQLGSAGERYDATVPRGSVLSQDPPPDTPVRIRSRVLVLVSLGEEFGAVPEMVGSSVRGARLALDHVGLGFAGSTRAASDEVGEDMVVGSDPPAGTIVAHNAPVGLLISAGPFEEEFVMPDLLGRDLAATRTRLVELGFKVAAPERAHGPVMFQSPAAGSHVTRGSAIFLQAARGRR